jgi:hypothetical protein
LAGAKDFARFMWEDEIVDAADFLHGFLRNELLLKVRPLFDLLIPSSLSYLSV